jgi:hypothetical protein
MDYPIPIVIAVVVASPVVIYVILYLTGRAWQRRHTYVDDFWQSGGW